MSVKRERSRSVSKRVSASVRRRFSERSRPPCETATRNASYTRKTRPYSTSRHCSQTWYVAYPCIHKKNFRISCFLNFLFFTLLCLKFPFIIIIVQSSCTLQPQFWYVPELNNSGTYQNCLSHVAILEPVLYNSGTSQKCLNLQFWYTYLTGIN